jgi:hypothetical protein
MDTATVGEVASRGYPFLEFGMLWPLGIHVVYGITLVGLAGFALGGVNSPAVFGPTSSGGTALFGGFFLVAGFLALVCFALAAVAVIGTAIALYTDAHAIVTADVGWQPTPLLWALGGLVLGPLVTGVYLYKRHQAVVDRNGREWWWLVALSTLVPSVLIPVGAVAFYGTTSAVTAVSMLSLGVGLLTAPLLAPSIYRDAMYVRSHTSHWQPNPGLYLSMALLVLVFVPVCYPLVGGYYLYKRNRAIDTSPR